MSKKKITVGHTTLIGGQGATFGEKGLEKEAHEKKSEIMKSQIEEEERREKRGRGATEL